MESELKPCPFCGGTARVYQIPRILDPMNEGLWIVGCDGDNGNLCPGYLWKCTPLYFTEEVAVRMWNHRK